ncbi:MAG: nucleoside 2-deoxyribosyltransferase [Chloroflexi bacterium]|nr:nucleoside 2-deoxyribosyltransferase [Chloroflexota bacterium]
MPYRGYLAARYSRRDELNRYREQLNDTGIEVTSRWLTTDPPAPVAELTDSHWSELAQADIDDVRRADALVAFAGDSDGGGGGRHVELGVALALERLVVVVGTPEHLFHRLPQARGEPDWEGALARLRDAARGSR